jgi:DNA polymerase
VATAAPLVTKQRGELIESDLAPLVTATVHPSSVLRGPDEVARKEAMHDFVTDLAMVARELYG